MISQLLVCELGFRKNIQSSIYYFRAAFVQVGAAAAQGILKPILEAAKKWLSKKKAGLLQTLDNVQNTSSIMN
jgi:hypothetical protein